MLRGNLAKFTKFTQLRTFALLPLFLIARSKISGIVASCSVTQYGLFSVRMNSVVDSNVDACVDPNYGIHWNPLESIGIHNFENREVSSERRN